MALDWKAKKEEEINKTDITVEQQLDLFNELDRAKYQNGLVMKSLNEYTNKFNERDKLYEKYFINFRNNMKDLSNSNEVLSKNIKGAIRDYEKELIKVTDNVSKVNKQHLREIENQVNRISSELERIQKKSILYQRIVTGGASLILLLLLYIAFIK